MTLEDTASLISFNIRALIDCGTIDCFINNKWVEKKKLEVTHLEALVPIYKSDGTKTSACDITGCVGLKMNYKGHEEVV